MRRSTRAAVTLAASLAVLLTLTSCTPATFMWGNVGDDGELQVAFCARATVSAIRVSVSERPVSQLVEVQSAVWSGPPVFLPSGAILDGAALPDGWQTTNDLDLDGEWDRIDFALYQDDVYVDSAILDHRDVSRGEWRLSPEPGLVRGTSDCPEPFASELDPDASDTATSTTEIDQLRAIAMPEPDFWTYIALVDSSSATADTSGLVDELSRLAPESVAGFEAQLRLQLNSLDRAEIWNESESQRLTANVYVSTADWFASYRCRIIVGGAESVLQALSGESLPVMTRSGGLPPLLSAAPSAAYAGSLVPDGLQSALLPGMGANTDGW